MLFCCYSWGAGKRRIQQTSTSHRFGEGTAAVTAAAPGRQSETVHHTITTVVNAAPHDAGVRGRRPYAKPQRPLSDRNHPCAATRAGLAVQVKLNVSPSQLKGAICHSSEWQIAPFSSEGATCLFHMYKWWSDGSNFHPLEIVRGCRHTISSGVKFSCNRLLLRQKKYVHIFTSPINLAYDSVIWHNLHN